MQTNKFVLMSIFLFFGQYYNVIQSSSGSCLAFDPFPTTSAPNKTILSRMSWKDISNMRDDSGSTINHNNDNLQKENKDIQKIYNNTSLLLLKKIKYWLDQDEDLNTIGYYLGYDKATIDLINFAMTELSFAKRNAKVSKNMDCLEALFYYSCDIGHMAENKNVVKNKFIKFIGLFQSKMMYFTKIDEHELRKHLGELLINLSKKTHAWYNVSIKSMKMRIQSISSNDELISSIKNRLVNLDSNTSKSINELVELYATETDGVKVNAYHVYILGFLITDIFGYVYNHFEFLYKLQHFELDLNDENTINQFKKVVYSIKSILVYRFFEFKGETSFDLFDAINSIDNILNSPLEANDFCQPKSEHASSQMKFIMDSAVQTVLTTFTGESLEDWKVNRSSKIVYSENCNDKNTLIQLIEENTKKALNNLDTFYCELGNFDL